MKKIITLLLIICTLAFILCACTQKQNLSPADNSEASSDTQSEVSSEASSEPSSSESSSPVNSQGSSFMPEISSDNKAFLSKFASNSLDFAYEEELESAFSASEWVAISKKYSDFWEEEINNAYKCLLVEVDDTASIKNEQINWISFCEDKISEIETNVQAEGGSLARFNAANKIMLIYRERAAALYEDLYEYDPDFSFSFVANG